MKKIRAWIKRYLPAEIAGTLTALLGGIIGNYIVHNDVVIAFFASWGENVGYYGTIIISDLKNSVSHHKNNKLKYGFRSLVKDFRNIIVEFGPGELLDSFVVRPFTIFLFTKLTGNFVIGVIVGKIAADIIFYLPTVVMLEVRQKFLK